MSYLEVARSRPRGDRPRSVATNTRDGTIPSVVSETALRLKTMALTSVRLVGSWDDWGDPMRPLVSRKKEKVRAIFAMLGEDASESDFVRAFIEAHPEDWARIRQRWREGVPDMQEPSVYTREMCRNHRPRGQAICGGVGHGRAEEGSREPLSGSCLSAALDASLCPRREFGGRVCVDKSGHSVSSCALGCPPSCVGLRITTACA